jgi:hypothetical protein
MPTWELKKLGLRFFEDLAFVKCFKKLSTYLGRVEGMSDGAITTVDSRKAVSLGGMRLSPLDTSTTIWATVPAAYDGRRSV